MSVSGTAISTKTDSIGRFRLVLPHSSASLRISHALLDSLGISFSTNDRSLADSTFWTVALPSPRSLVAAKCSAQERARGPAMLAGVVVDAVTGEPASDANISVSWIDYEARGRSITRTPQRRSAQVSATGAFKLCGLPDGMVEGVTASRGADTTAGVDVDLTSLIDIVAFRIPPSRTTSSSHGTVSISGKVLDLHGKAAAGARVAIESDSVFATTNENGFFTLTDVRTGTRAVSIRKLGYEAVEIPIDVPRDGLTGTVLWLGRSVEMLRAMIVTASLDTGLKRVGYEARRRIIAGSFVGPADIDRINPSTVQHVLDRIPRFKRGGCVRYWVDGRLVPEGEPPDNFISGVEIGAVEVYTESFVPPEFPAFTRNGRPCRGVILWTKWKIGLR